MGGSKEVAVDDKDVVAAAEEVVKHLSSQSNSLDKMSLAEVSPRAPLKTVCAVPLPDASWWPASERRGRGRLDCVSGRLPQLNKFGLDIC